MMDAGALWPVVLWLTQGGTLLLLRRLLKEHDCTARNVRKLREAWAAKHGELLD